MTETMRHRLAVVCQVNPKFGTAGVIRSEELVSFVPMAAVDETFGEIVKQEARPISEVRRGYTPFRDGDVLFAKITPCMQNGKAALTRDLMNGMGFGSTEFHVLRAGPLVLPAWIFRFVRRPAFRVEAARNFTGTAGQQRVPTTFIENAQIPVPPLEVQRRLCEQLDRAEGILRLRREAQRKAAELIPALFLDRFGDPASNPKSWPMAPFGDLGQLDRGRSRHRPRDAQELYGGNYPFIQTGDVANSGGLITKYTQTYSELGLAQSRLWPTGTLCITIAANIAKTGILTFDACFPDSVVGFKAGSQVNIDYIQQWLGFLQPTLEKNAPQAAQKNINLEILRGLPVPVPPRDLQEHYSQQVSSISSIRAQQKAALDTAQATFDALLHRAFAQ